MRAFFAIELAEETRAALHAVGRAASRAQPAWHDQKWVSPANLHLTLAFLGELDGEIVGTLMEQLDREVATLSSFELRFETACTPVPSARRASMLWATLDDPDGKCAALARATRDVAAAFGIETDDRPYVPHVTLCRARRPRRFARDELPADASLMSAHPALTHPVSVSAATLFESTLTRQGPRYTRLDVTRLVD